MPLMKKNTLGQFVDVSGVPVPKPQPSKVEPVNSVNSPEPVPMPPMAPSPLTEPIPDGRWGMSKVIDWFDENGLAVPDVTKKELVVIAKELHAEQGDS